MRLLVIDDAVESLIRVEKFLRQAMPEASVVLWNPGQQGRPKKGFEWQRYDCLLLADTPADGADALEWLREFRQQPGMPPTIVLSDGGEELAVKAIKAGASDYLKKSELTPVKLAMTIKEAKLEASRPPRDEQSLRMTQSLSVADIGHPADAQVIAAPGYRVLRRIGEGGMSKVYLAERTSDGLQLVLKVLDPRMRHDKQFRARLEREYHIIQRLHNEHVAMVFDHGFDGDTPYIAMEYFPGGDLQQRIRAGMGSMAAFKILVQIAEALDAVHSAGIVHRDLKPQNIMFRDNNRLAILDFGLARELDATSTLTQKGMVMATPLYMSPEQCLGRPHDPRGDLYSTGVILYEMLTGQHVFMGENASQLAYQHVHGPIPRLPRKIAGYQPLVDRLLAKNPAERFQSARELFNFIVH